MQARLGANPRVKENKESQACYSVDHSHEISCHCFTSHDVLKTKCLKWWFLFNSSTTQSWSIKYVQQLYACGHQVARRRNTCE